MENGYQIDVKKLGRRINELRHDKNGKVVITQDDLAEKAGLGGKSQISKYEKGQVPNISVETLLRFSQALDCEPDYLLGRIDHPKRSTSEISERIPLTREAIESLESMMFRLNEWGDSESILLGYYILSDLIVHIDESLQRPFIKDGVFVHTDDFLGNIIDLLFAYESIFDYVSTEVSSFQTEQDLRTERLTIRGVSSWLGNDIAEVMRASIKKYADRDNILTEEA